jgi:polysaccharide biosynthesis/export protein
MKTIRNISPFVVAFACAATQVVLCGLCDAQQNSPVIGSNLEQTAAVTSTRRALASNGGPTVLPDDFTKLRLASGYQLEMAVFGVPEMDCSLRVDDDGNVIVPLVGVIHVAGQTLNEAEKAIEHELIAKELINSPSVHLKITAFAAGTITVSGEVQSPGKLQSLAPRSLLSVLADAGGETTAADGRIEIHHPSADGTEQVVTIRYISGKDLGEANKAIVSPGDTVYVPRAGVVYVLGAVNRPGGYLMVSGGALDLPQAVGLALGVSPTGSSKSVIVVRKHGDEVGEYHLRLDDMQRGKSEIFALKDGDMVYVPTDKIKAALINSSAVLSAAASATIVSTVK